MRAESEKYIYALERQLNDIPKVIRTQHPIISALLTTEYQRTKNEGIDTHLEIHLEKEFRLAPIDICVLVGNILDNAVEYCCCLPKESQRFIHISILQKNLSIRICVQNSYDHNIKKIAYYSEKHGYGLKNINKIVEKYNGKINITILDNTYEILVLIP